jgi:type I restriction enzyme S subunit
MMEEGLRAYSDYQYSGDEWIGRIPCHWSVKSLGTISQRKSIRNRTDLPLLSVLREKGVVLRTALGKDENHNFIPDDLSNYQVAHEGDLVVNKMKAWQGSVGIAPQDGIVSPAYFIFDLSGITKEYAHCLLRSRVYADFFGRASDGVRIGQWDLGIPAMKRIPVVIPPAEEQKAIASYLKKLDRSVARFIRNRRRLIAVLNEQKQAIINRAVTRGLDPDVPLKPSGMDWIGEIPEHWEVRRNGTLFQERVEPGNNEFPILVVSLRTGVTIAEEIDHRGRPKRVIEDRTKYRCAYQGDIAYNMMRFWQGAVGVAPVNGLVSPAYVVAQPRKNVFPQYFECLFRTPKYMEAINCESRGIVSDRNRTYWINFKSIPSPLPPFEEQRRIVEFIQEQIHSLLIAEKTANREINLIQEYRTRLIADVVTGQVDVRHLAPPPGADEEAEDPAETIDGMEDESESENFTDEIEEPLDP